MDINGIPSECSFETVDDVLALLNPYGRFQWILNALFSVSYSSALLHIILPYFISREPPWQCIANSTLCQSNNTMTNAERCHLPRIEWEFTESIEFSIVSQFDLVCDRAWLNHMSTSCLYIGWALSALYVGGIADRYGRKVIVFPSVALIFVVTMIPALVPNIYALIASRFIIGVLISGVSPVSLILMGEFVDTKHRPLAMVIMYIAHSFSWMMLCVQAYFVRPWKYLMITCMIPYISVLGFYKFIPESIHWLHLHELKEELNGVFKKIAYWNEVVLPEDNISQRLASPKRENSAGGFKEIFVTWLLLTKTLNLSCSWFTVVMLYFGLSLGADDLGGSIYVNFVLICFIEIPACIFVEYATRNFGRKPTVSVTMIFAGVFCFLLFFLPVSGKSKIICVACGISGKACATVTYNSLYIWSFESYPTPTRGSGVGFLTFIGRCGGAATPWVVKLLLVVDKKLPYIIMGSLAIACGLLLLVLPETKHLETSEMGILRDDDYEEMD